MSRYRQALAQAGDAVFLRAHCPEEALVKISAETFRSCPETLTLRVGGTVTWVNLDDDAHSVVSLSGLFRSAALRTAESFSFRFLQPGLYRYVCTIYPRMVGSIVVG